MTKRLVIVVFWALLLNCLLLGLVSSQGKLIAACTLLFTLFLSQPAPAVQGWLSRQELLTTAPALALI
jgi:hypothetical protein